ncbi:type II toxin-antitoxin system RelE/ParE family toxin [Rhizobium sp. RU36D]|uniref:type II toxin-antitoxin system RelE/ParE family toxin n=1 Tax=Rhizobium sp. RU36D TaxID=1907415 RepID=UPI0024532E52|nr:type II toxin-antitoxin system RelE/ParE family toxin [Rhizobium sp. RU36D]
MASEAGHHVAGQYLDRIEAACLSLSVFPERGTVRDHILPGLRIIGFERHASIALIVEGDRVRILRILHGRQDYPRTWSED